MGRDAAVDRAGAAAVPLEGVRGVGVGPGRGVGRLGPREPGARVAPWPPWLQVPRCGHPGDFSLWVTGPGGRGVGRRRGRAAPQVSLPQGHAEVWWEGRGRAHRRALWRVPEGRAGCSPAPADPGAQRGSPSPRGDGARARARAVGILAGTLSGTPQVAQSGLPPGLWIPRGKGWGSAQGALPGPQAAPGERRPERDVEGLRRRQLGTLPLSEAPLGLQSDCAVPPPPRGNESYF